MRQYRQMLNGFTVLTACLLVHLPVCFNFPTGQDATVPPAKSFSPNIFSKEHTSDKDSINDVNSDFIITDPNLNEGQTREDILSAVHKNLLAMRERRALLDRIDGPREWAFSQHQKFRGNKRGILDRIDRPRQWNFNQHRKITSGKRGLLDRIDTPREWNFNHHLRNRADKRAGILDRIDAPREWTFSQHQRIPGVTGDRWRRLGNQGNNAAGSEAKRAPLDRIDQPQSWSNQNTKLYPLSKAGESLKCPESVADLCEDLRRLLPRLG